MVLKIKVKENSQEKGQVQDDNKFVKVSHKKRKKIRRN
jgi:hypothetical protein